MNAITLMDTSFVKLGELTRYVSLRVTRSYCGVGAFELTAHPDEPCALTLAPDVLLFAADDPQTVLLCEEISLTRERLTAKGTTLKGLAKRRVCVPPLTLPARLWRWTSGAWAELTDPAAIRAAMLTDDVLQGFTKPLTADEGACFLDLTELGAAYDWGAKPRAGAIVSDLDAAQTRSRYQNFGWDRFVGSAESAYLHYAANNLTAPEDTNRAMPALVLAADRQRGTVLPWQARFERLDAFFETIGEATGLGWDVAPDFVNRRFVLGAWQGEDRSQGVSVALISERMGNASSVTRRLSESGSATTAYVGGAGEDEARFILAVGGDETGLARRELWTEAGSLTDPDLLRLCGQNRLDAAKPVHTLTAELIDSGACRYRRDYDVGDKVLLRGAFGEAAVRISAVTETFENGRRSLEAVFGDAPVTVGKVLKRRNGAIV